MGKPKVDPRTVRAREAMIRAAERLFSERGIEAVSLREVGAVAGQRNNSAAQYHFGTREGLVDAVEPVFGARLLGVNVLGSGVSGSVGYRRSFQSGATTSERLSADLTYGKGRGLNLLGSFEYDLILNRIAGLRALGRYDGNLFAAQIEALRIQPTYTSYSIWYYFAAAPRDELRVRGDLTPLGPLRYYAQLSATHYNLDISDVLGLKVSVDHRNPGGSVHIAYRDLDQLDEILRRLESGG